MSHSSRNSALQPPSSALSRRSWLSASVLVWAALTQACGSKASSSDGGPSSTETPFYADCTDAETFGDVTLSEGQCVCEASVEQAEDILRQCGGDDAYDGALASCSSSAFQGYQSSCTLSLAEWASCREMLFGLPSCEDLEAAVEMNLNGCVDLFDELLDCLILPDGL